MAYKFYARLFLTESDGVIELRVFAPFLDPMVFDKRPIEDWAREALENWSERDFRDALNIPTGDYQVLIEATIDSIHTSSFDGDDWEDEIDIEKIEVEPIPKEFLDVLFGKDEEKS